MLMRFHSLFFFFLTVTNNLDVEAVVARLQARYHSARTLQATFLERYRENGRVVRVEAGTAYFRRPGKMRWEYDARSREPKRRLAYATRIAGGRHESVSSL